MKEIVVTSQVPLEECGLLGKRLAKWRANDG